MTYRVLLVDQLLAAGAAAGPVLGLETGTPVARIGIVGEGRVMASVNRPARSHGADLPDLVDAAMAEAGLRMADLAAIAVGIGPGSFTGLRVGLSYAKGLIIASSLKLVGISSLDAMALCGATRPEASAGTAICPLIDARRGEVYTSLYRVGADALERLSGDLVVTLEDFANQTAGEVVFVGEQKAQEACAFVQRRGGGVGAHAGNAELKLAGAYIAALGAERIARGESDRPESLEPRYVRPSGAAINSATVNWKEGVENGTSRGRANPAACRS